MARRMELVLQGLGTYKPDRSLPEDQLVPIPWFKPGQLEPDLNEPGIMNPGQRRQRPVQVAGGGLPWPSLAKGATGMDPPVLSTYSMDRALANYEQQKLLLKALKDMRK